MRKDRKIVSHGYGICTPTEVSPCKIDLLGTSEGTAWLQLARDKVASGPIHLFSRLSGGKEEQQGHFMNCLASSEGIDYLTCLPISFDFCLCICFSGRHPSSKWSLLEMFEH